MKVIDVLISSCELLGLDAEKAILVSTTQENESTALNNKQIKSLYNLMKFSTQELCTRYVPVLTSQEITTENKKYPISSLTNYVRMKNVTKNDSPVDYKVVNRNIVVDKDDSYVVKYFTYPSITSMFNEIDYFSTFSPDVVVLGLCAYYSLSHGMFEDFEHTHNLYVKKAESIKTLKVFETPQRRWE